MGNGTQELYSIVVQNIETMEVDKTFIWLNKKDAKIMKKRTNEVVYKIYQNNQLHQWKLVELNKK